MIPPPPRSTPFPYTTLFRSRRLVRAVPQDPHAACLRFHHGFLRHSYAVVSTRPYGCGCGPMSLAMCGTTAYEWRRKRSEEHTSELQSHLNLVCRLLLQKKKL